MKSLCSFLSLIRINVSSEFKKIQESADLVDITFSCDGKQFGAHKLVLFACSPYFREILKVKSYEFSNFNSFNSFNYLIDILSIQIEKSMFASGIFHQWC